MGDKKYYYLEIKSLEDGKVVKRFDLTSDSQHNRDKCERGANINLNHEKYYTFSFDSETKLDVIK